jgi:hypothetical protein
MFEQIEQQARRLRLRAGSQVKQGAASGGALDGDGDVVAGSESVVSGLVACVGRDGGEELVKRAGSAGSGDRDRDRIERGHCHGGRTS